MVTYAGPSAQAALAAESPLCLCFQGLGRGWLFPRPPAGGELLQEVAPGSVAALPALDGLTV